MTGAWLAGSLGRGGGDDLSDIDLWIVVLDDEIDAIRDDPKAFVEAIARPALILPAPQNALPGGAYLLTLIPCTYGLQQVDWYWVPASTAVRPPSTKAVLDHAPIPIRDPLPPDVSDERDCLVAHWVAEAIVMAFITDKRIRRGGSWVIASHLQHVANCVGSATWCATHGTARTHDDPIELALPPNIPTTSGFQRRTLHALLARLESPVASLPDDPGQTLSSALDRVRSWMDRESEMANL